MYPSHPSPFSLRPHLQRDSARAEESSPANLSRSRCFGGGDELFGSFVEFESILKRKAPFQNEFQYLCQKYVYICERHRCEWWILNLYESFCYCSHLVFRNSEGGLAPIGASILHRRNFAHGSYMWRAVALCTRIRVDSWSSTWNYICKENFDIYYVVGKTSIKGIVDQLVFGTIPQLRICILLRCEP